MQQNQKPLIEKGRIGLIGTAWTFGLLIAGSDSPFMPWLNGAGLVLFFGASILLGKIVKPSQSNADTLRYSKFHEKPGVSMMVLKKNNNRINNRYALDF
ncbi:MAG: hypothetical protein KKE44_00980 [Proteobacteria bacterium]|nr:hypothetical protein [Pseudomonadota bacterium]MBU1581300.1 hypothetical protein [Pseudomonadota bacterium]MBU2627054.1 hypothetical protein [Pseudomonadota bacterium]